MSNLTNALSRFDIPCPEVAINDLVLDSRAVKQGDAFIAIKGHHLDGGHFVDNAQKKGAKLILADVECELSEGVDRNTVISITNLSAKLGQIASDFYASPSENLSCVGITGTNGKSTTAFMVAALAEACGISSAVIGTLGYGKINSLKETANTTPSAVELQKQLSVLAVENQLVAMEVSSHGLEQGRLNGCQFKVNVFTNLSRDHLDYHGTMQAYQAAKYKLFSQHKAEFSVLNVNDPVTAEWATELENCVFFGMHNQQADLASIHSAPYVYFSKPEFLSNGLKTLIESSWGKAEILVPLFGEFNLHNLTAALATLLVQGFEFDSLISACQQLQPVPGRMQLFTGEKHTVVVDYAHTPDALERALSSLKMHCMGRLICVFGCGGDRDSGKRPLMAKAAEQYSELVVITNDNPRSENPQQIANQIQAGFTTSQNSVIELERGAAINHALDIAKPEDIVLIAGKGHEDYQIIGDQVHQFDDRAWVTKQLQLRGSKL